MTEFTVYSEHLSSLARSALAGMEADAARPDVYLGVAAALRLLDGAPEDGGSALRAGLSWLSGAARRGDLGSRPLLPDEAGHRRAVCDLLVAHVHLLAARRVGASVSPEERRAAADAATGVLAAMAEALAPYREAPPGADAFAETLWRALVLADAGVLVGGDRVADTAAAVVERILGSPGDDGALHAPEPNELPDTWTYRELAALHALVRLALESGRGSWLARVERAAGFHLVHTQPDHVTSQPWGLPAFLRFEATRIFADQQLHDAAAQGGGRIGAVAALLMCDAVDALARYATTDST